MNHAQGLKPLTPEQAREYGSRGGRASGRARREKKALKEYAELLLSLPVQDAGVRDGLAELGIPDERMDNRMRLIAGLLTAACGGNVPAAKELRSILGEDKPPEETAVGGVIEIASVERS